MTRSRIFLAALLTAVLIPISGHAEPPLKKVLFIPQWVPQAQFAGYYYAAEKGIYKKHGLDVTILPGGPQSPPLDLLVDGKADFGTLWLTTGIQARSQGVNLINIAQILPRSALMLVAKKSSGIQNAWDIRGKKVGLWVPIFQVQPRAFFMRYGLEVSIIPQSFSVNLFLRDGVDVASAMWYNEYHTILASGLNPEELTTFFFHEHGLNFPEDGIYVMEDRFRQDPEMCKSFVRGSVEGWEAAFANAEECLDMVMKNLKREYIPATRVHQRWMLQRMRDLMVPPDANRLNAQLISGDYSRVATNLHAAGLIDTIPEFASFYQDCTDHGAK